MEPHFITTTCLVLVCIIFFLISYTLSLYKEQSRFKKMTYDERKYEEALAMQQDRKTGQVPKKPYLKIVN